MERLGKCLEYESRKQADLPPYNSIISCEVLFPARNPRSTPGHHFVIYTSFLNLCAAVLSLNFEESFKCRMLILGGYASLYTVAAHIHNTQARDGAEMENFFRVDCTMVRSENRIFFIIRIL